MTFDLRFDDDEEIKITASLDADGFVDVHNANNTAEIVIPQVIVTTQNDPQTDDESVGTADASGGDSAGGNASASGGGSSGIEWFAAMLALLAPGLRRYAHTSPVTRRQQPVI